MRVTLTSGEFTLAEECASETEAFEKMARWGDLFSKTICGVCGSPAKFQLKTPQNYKYYSMGCTNVACRHELKFGIRQEDGGLFMKLKDQEGNYLPNGGWVPPYQGQGQRPQQQRPQQNQYSQPESQAPQQQKTLTDEEIPFSLLLPFAMGLLYAFQGVLQV